MQNKKLTVQDASRDVGEAVVRFDQGYTQGQTWTDIYRHSRTGRRLKGKDGKLLRLIDFNWSVIDGMPPQLKLSVADLFEATQSLLWYRDGDAFGDELRSRLVRKYSPFPDRQIDFEYYGLIARKVNDSDRLAMHLDHKNDGRGGYNNCCTYSYVIDGYRVTIVMATRQDWGRLMERIREVDLHV